MWRRSAIMRYSISGVPQAVACLDKQCARRLPYAQKRRFSVHNVVQTTLCWLPDVYGPHCRVICERFRIRVVWSSRPGGSTAHAAPGSGQPQVTRDSCPTTNSEPQNTLCHVAHAPLYRRERPLGPHSLGHITSSIRTAAAELH